MGTHPANRTLSSFWLCFSDANDSCYQLISGTTNTKEDPGGSWQETDNFVLIFNLLLNALLA